MKITVDSVRTRVVNRADPTTVHDYVFSDGAEGFECWGYLSIKGDKTLPLPEITKENRENPYVAAILDHEKAEWEAQMTEDLGWDVFPAARPVRGFYAGPKGRPSHYRTVEEVSAALNEAYAEAMEAGYPS